MRRLIVMTLVGLLFVGFAGCGGDDKDSAAGEVKAASSTGDDSSSDAADDSSSKSDSSDSASGNSASASVAGVFSSQECLEAIQAISAAYSAAGLAMSGQTAEIEKTQKQFDAFAKKAPEDIRGDIETLRDAYGEYGTIISESGWKPGTTPPQSVIDALQKASDHLESDEVKTANDRVETWFKDQCGN